jgi:DNA polymerase-3 subunit gamma/tau
MATLEPGETLARLLARIEALEGRLGGGDGGAPGGSSAGGTRAGGARAPVAGGVRSAAAEGPVRSAGPASAYPSAPPGPPFPSRGTGAPSGAPARLTPPGAGFARMPETPAAASRSEAAAPDPAVAGPQTAGAGATLGATRVAAGAAALDEPAYERDDATDEIWRDAIRGVNGTKRMLGAFLEESLFLGLAGETLVLAMDDLHRTVVEEKENRALLATEVRRAFGRPLTVRCVPPVGDGQQRAAPADVRPLVDQAIAWFQGDVIERTARKAERSGQ